MIDAEGFEYEPTFESQFEVWPSKIGEPEDVLIRIKEGWHGEGFVDVDPVEWNNGKMTCELRLNKTLFTKHMRAAEVTTVNVDPALVARIRDALARFTLEEDE